MGALWMDVRFSLRVLRAQRQFSMAAVIVLALGSGATTAVFSVVNAVLLRPLPYPEPDRLVAITGVFKSDSGSRPTAVVPLADVAEWRARSNTLSSMGAFAYTQLPVRVGDQAFSPVTALMDPQFLPTVQTPLAMGTYFDEAAGAGDLTVIVSDPFWRAAFHADPSVIGRGIVVDGRPYTIRGVLRPDFQFPRSDASYYPTPIELLLPAATFPGFPARSRQWFAIARLRDDVAREQAQTELQSVAESLSRDGKTGDAWSVTLTSLHEETTRRAREPLLVVLAIAVVLLMIAATNLMNLFFSRGVARLREMSIRRAIGGSASRLVRLLLIEALLLALIGGALGVLFAASTIDIIVAMSPVHLPVTAGITIDRRVLWFTTIVAAAATLVASLVPALHASAKADETVRNPGMRVSMGRGVARVQQALCVTQIGLGMALLTGAGLLASSLWQLSAVDPGFDTSRAIGFNLSVPNDLSLEDRRRFYAGALAEVRTIAGVDGAGLISFLPPETRAGVFMNLSLDGVPEPERGQPPRIANTLVSSVDYFRTMRMPLVSGRDFAATDDQSRPPVAIVNEALARRYFPDAQAIGRRIGTGFDRLKPVREIVGVVRDTHDRGLGVAPYPTVFIPFTQFALPYASMVVRTDDPGSAIPVIRDRIQRLNRAVPVVGFQSLETRLHESLREPRFYTVLALTCAAMAVLFVTFGLYGLVSYSVSRRTSELGVRMAVGAERRAILYLVLAQGLRMSAAGVALGLVLAFAFTRALRSLLFQVTPTDPATLALAAMLVIAVALVASYAPARRASRVNPLVALRHE